MYETTKYGEHLKNWNRHQTEAFLLFFLGLSIGFGGDLRLSFGFYLCLILCDNRHLYRIYKNLCHAKAWITLLILFYFFYWFHYEASIYRRHDQLITSIFKSKDWLTLIAWTLLSILPVFGASKNFNKLNFVVAELIGCSLWGIAIISLSIINFPPPYYGSLHNPIYGFEINSPGPAYLISMSALLFYGQFIHKSITNNAPLKIVSTLFFIVSVWLSLFIQQRTFYIISFILCPLFLVFLMWDKRLKKRGWLMLIAGIPLAYLALKPIIERDFGVYRKLGMNITQDLRIRLYKNWFEQFLENPLSRIQVSLLENPVHGIPTVEFHNFFMDVSRFSGAIALLLSIILFGYILFAIKRSLKDAPDIGNIAVLFFAPLFLIINTAVFPEGEIQFVLIIFSIVSVVEGSKIRSA